MSAEPVPTPPEQTLEQQRTTDALDAKLARAAEAKRQRESARAPLHVRATDRFAVDAPCEHLLESGEPCGQSATKFRNFPAWCSACSRAESERLAARSIRDRAVAGEIGPHGLSLPHGPPLPVPAKYAGVTFDNFELHGDEPNRRRLERLLGVGRSFVARFPDRHAATFPQILVLQGGHGSGKNHWTWSVANAVRAEHRASVLVTRVADFVHEIRSTWGRRDGPTETAVLARYRRADLVIFNELSRHALLNEPMQHLFDVIDPRQEEYRPTIIVSNETDDAELAALLGPALTSRIREWSGLLDFGSVDYRATILAARRKAARSEGA